MNHTGRLTDKERQVRGLDALGAALYPLVDERMRRSAHGKDWVALYQAAQSARVGRPYRVDPRDPRALLRIVRHERQVFTDITPLDRAWIDELIQASNAAAHSPSVPAQDAERALDTMVRLAQSLKLEDAVDAVIEIQAMAGPPLPSGADAVTSGFVDESMSEAADPASERAAEAAPDERVEEPAASSLPGPAPMNRVPEVVAPHGASILSARIGDLDVIVAVTEAINYALVHNDISPVHSVSLVNNGPAPIEGTRLTLQIESPLPDGVVAQPLVIDVDHLGPGEVYAVPTRSCRWTMSQHAFLTFDEAVGTTVEMLVVTSEGRARDTATVRLLTADEWWAASLPEVLATFVRPNNSEVGKLLADASDLLQQRTGTPSLDGYQAGPDRVHQIAESIFDALQARQIRYVEPPRSFEGTGQRIRSHTEVLTDRLGTCLDIACLYAAALEQAGIHPVLTVTKNHAFTGYLTEDRQLPGLTVAASDAIITLADSDLFEAVETTAICAGDEAASFDQARGLVRKWWTNRLDDVVHLLDVHAAHRRVRPLPAIVVQDGVRVVEVVREAVVVPARSVPATEAATGERHHAPARVERWRRALLDMTYSNPLLKLKKSSSIPLHVPADGLGRFEDLVALGERLTIVPHDKIADIHRAQGARTAADVDPLSALRILVEEKRIHAALSSFEYQRRIRALVRKAKTALEETGNDSLYLTVGTLHWTERTKEGRAPLFLVPVRLTGGRGTTKFVLEYDNTRQVQANHCLVEKLRVSWGLHVPQLVTPGEDDAGIDVGGALAAVRSALLRKELSNFHVEETAHLALLQFSTLDMWRDISENWPAFLERPAVRHLVETPGQPYDDAVDPPAPAPDAEATAFLPIPADGSQLEAVRWAAAGRSFILEGPPGTGKSQSITNLVAHLLAEGKKVLFVAEKQAALDVVKKRLDAVGLGVFSLDVHGRTQTVRAVRAQLSAALEIAQQGTPGWESARASYRNVVESLARYPELLHEDGPAGLSAWGARQNILELGEVTNGTPGVAVPRGIVMGTTDLAALYNAGRDVGLALLDLGVAPGASPWSIAGPVGPDRIDRNALTAALRALVAADEKVVFSGARELAAHACTMEEFRAVGRWLNSVAAGMGYTTATARDLATPQWRAHARQAKDAVDQFRQATDGWLGPFAPGVVAADLDVLVTRAAEADKRLFGRKKRRLAVLADLGQFLPNGYPKKPKELAADLNRLIQLRDEVRRLTDFVATLPGITVPYGWNPLEESEAKFVEHAVAGVEAAVSLDTTLVGGRAEAATIKALLDECTGQVIADPAALPSGTGNDVAVLGEVWSNLLEVLGSTPDDVGFWIAGRTRAAALAASLPDWQADGAGGAYIRLQRWLRVRVGLEALSALGVDGADSPVRRGDLRGPDVENALRVGVAHEVLAERLSSTGLEAFDEVDRVRMIDRFITAGDDIRGQMRTELPAMLARSRTFDPTQPKGAVAELQAQLGRRRGGMTIRQLMEQFGNLITQVTPCFLMSPGSVARFLPSDIEFDVVVFDEASQIRVPDAIGAMGRGRSVVIVGDSQQMPPSSTFATASGEDDDEATTRDGLPVQADMESILSEGTESRLNRLLLTWHYRSRDESLIAFSNRAYYDDRLSSFPTPPDGQSTAIELRHVAGVWEGGGRSAARVNRAEAEAIVAEIRYLAEADPGRSIGVVTFNSQQRDLILDRLEELRIEDQAVEAALSRAEEPLFVKNLENVQGDERDVVLFTLAFAKDARGKVPLNWGPLSREGGEKRLNVAITRAKQRVVVFSSFAPHELDLSTSSSRGLAHLKDYLQMIDRGVSRSAIQGGAAARDRHLDEIAAALSGTGLEVRTGIGLSDFRVDLAVRADGGPWTAVLLDGPAWRARTTVGDRDGLPVNVLTGQMGWARVERIWLPTWLRDRELVARQIVEAARNAEAEPGRQPAERGGVAVPGVAGVVAAGASAVRGSWGSEAAGVNDGIKSVEEVPVVAPVATARVAASPASDLPDHVRRYEPAATDSRYEPSELDGTDRAAQDRIRSVMLGIAEEEGPILLDRLLRVTALRFGISRLRESRRDQLAYLVPGQMVVKAPNEDLVAWPRTTSPDGYTGYRVPATGGRRDISDVPYCELRNAMVRVVQAAYSMSVEETLRETAREFGVTRLASLVRPRLEGVLDAAVAEGVLERRGEHVHVC
ncbi:DUF3320 domain-containing protein [Myceligenerans halotolerans]